MIFLLYILLTVLSVQLVSTTHYDFILGYSTGHCGTTSLSSGDLYSNPTNVYFTFESLPPSPHLNTNLWQRWTFADEYNYVKQVLVPFMIQKRTSANAATYLDLGHQNLYYIDALVKYLSTETSYKFLLVRITSPRYESATSLSYSHERVKHPHICSMRFRYCPIERPATVINNPSSTAAFNNLTIFQQSLWLMDEVEERWSCLLRHNPNVDRIYLHWSRVKYPGFMEAASNMSRLFNISHTSLKHVHLKHHAMDLNNRTNLEINEDLHRDEDRRYMATMASSRNHSACCAVYGIHPCLL